MPDIYCLMTSVGDVNNTVRGVSDAGRRRKTITLRTERLDVRFSKMEMKVVEKKAMAWHTSMAAYARNAILNYRKGAK